MRIPIFPPVAMLVLVLSAGPAIATTWGSSKVEDPVSGQSIEVQAPASSGSYIYEWPGKEDQVFWPYTADIWLWFNPGSGYGAFGSEFSKLAGEDRERVKSWLAEHHDAKKPPVSRLEKLRWLEQIYGQRRDVDDDFWCYFYRLMAFELSKHDAAASLEYVRKALPLLESQLAGRQEPFPRVVTLYLLGEYQRRLGNLDVSHSYFQQAKSAPYANEDGKVLTGAPYIVKLIAEREALNTPQPPN